MSNPNIDKLVEISKNGVRKEMKIEELLDTTQWIWAGGEIIPHPDPPAPIVNNFNLGEGNIHIALNALKEKYVPVTKRLTHRFGKVWTVDEDAADTANVLEEAKFINSKAYVLNKNIYSSFLFPELKRFQNNNIDLPMMLGGNLNKYSDNGELIALYNTILMSGGSVTLDAYKPFEKIHNGIIHQLQKGDLKLTKKEKDRLVLLLKKNAKYTERVVLVYEYLKKYNSLPEDEKKGRKVLKKIVDKYEKLNKKKRKVNKNILDHIKEVISGKSEKKSKYYTENVPTTFIHKMDLSHLSGERVGRLLLEKFNKREDREKTKKLILCEKERKEFEENLNIMENLEGILNLKIEKLQEQVSDLEGMEEQFKKDKKSYEYISNKIKKEAKKWKDKSTGMEEQVSDLEGRSDAWEKDSAFWKEKSDSWKKDRDGWKTSRDYWKGSRDYWKEKSDSWKKDSDSWKEKFNEQMKLVEKLRKTGAPKTTGIISNALRKLPGNVTLGTDLTIRISGRPLRELKPGEIVRFLSENDNILRMLQNSDIRTRKRIQAILSYNFTPQQIGQLPPIMILYMLGIPVYEPDLVAVLSNMVKPARELATILIAKYEKLVENLRLIRNQVDINDLERLTEGALRDLFNQTKRLTDKTKATQLVRSNGIIDVIINLLNIEDASRRILAGIRGLLPNTPDNQDIIASFGNLENEDERANDLRLAITGIRSLLPAPVVISPEVFDEEGKLSQEEMAIFNNFDVSGDDTIPVATVPVVRIEDASAARANIPNNELVSNLMDYLKESERPPVVTLSEEDKTKYKLDRSNYNSTRKDCKKCNDRHYLPVNCDKDGIKRKCVGLDVKNTTTRGTSNMNRDDRRKVVTAKIEKLTR